MWSVRYVNREITGGRLCYGRKEHVFVHVSDKTFRVVVARDTNLGLERLLVLGARSSKGAKV